MQPITDFPWEWQHLTESTLVKTGQGVLHTIVINQLDPKFASFFVCNGLDAGGEVIALPVTQFPQPSCLVFDIEFSIGLYIIILNTGDLTVTYK